MKRLVILILMFACVVTVVNGQGDDVAQPTPQDLVQSLESQLQERNNPALIPSTRQYTVERIEVRKFDQRKWQEIVQSRNYTDTRERKTESEIESNGGAGGGRSGQRIREQDEERYEYDDEGGSYVDLSWLGPVGEVIFYVIIAAVILIIIVQVIRTGSFNANPERPLSDMGAADDIVDISELDTDNLIQKAHASGDFKLAIRLYFLDLLKKLNEHGIITWTKEKTNREYLSELFLKQYHYDQVRKLTQAYERVWYGEHVPTEQGYLELRSEFHEMNQNFRGS